MTSSVNFDRLFLSLGCFGRWQILHLLGASITWIHSNLTTLIIVIAGDVPGHWCGLDRHVNGTNLVNDGSCKIFNISSNESLTCNNYYVYNTSNVHSSIVSEWNLVCGRDYLPWMSQTVFTGGQFFGSFIFTYLSDRFGRKRSYLASHFFLILLEIGGSFVPDIYWFIVLRFFTGLAQIGLVTTVYVYIIEMFPLEKSHVVGVLFGFMGSLGVCFAAFLSYLMQDISWRYMHLTIGCLYLPLVYQIWFFDESVRWLWANNRKEEAYAILQKAASINKAQLPDVKKHLYSDEPMLSVGQTDKNESSAENQLIVYEPDINNKSVKSNKLNFIDIITHRKLRRHLFISWFIWPTQCTTYLGLHLMANELAGNRFLNLLLYGVVEMPSKLSLIFLSKRMGRKSMYSFLMIPCSLSLMIASVMSTPAIGYPKVTTAFTIIAKYFVSATFNVVWIFTPELYPTNLRSIGLGSASASSRFAGMAAPFAGYLARYIPWGPGAIFGVIGVTSCMLLKFLPETKNRPLIQTIEDVDSLYKINKKGTKT